MAVVQEVEVKYSASDEASRVTQNLRKNLNELEKTQHGLQKSLRAVGVATGIASVAIYKFGKQAFNEAARVQELDVSMQAIGKSTKVGYSALKEATEGIRGMGIELAASQKIAIQFAQNQLELGKAANVARVAQDLAVISQKNSTETTELLTAAIITGRTQLLKSAGIQKSAGQMYEDYAATLGKTAGQLNTVEKQQAVLNGVIAEGENVVGVYDASMTSAGKVLRSFPRIINDLQVEFGSLLLDGFGPLILDTYKTISAFSTMIRSNENVQYSLKVLGEVLQVLLKPLDTVLDGIKSWIENFDLAKGSIESTANKLLEFMPIIGAVVAALTTLGGKTILGLIPGLGGFAAALNPIAAGMAVLVALSPSLREQFVRLMQGLQPLIPVAMMVARALMEGIQRALVTIVPFIAGFVTGVVRVVEVLAGWIRIISQNAELMQFIIKVIQYATVAYLAYRTAVLIGTVITKGFAIAQGVLNKVLAMNPFVAVAMALIALVLAFKAAWESSQKFRDIVVKGLNFMIGAFEMWLNSVLNIVNKFIGIWNKIPFTEKVDELSVELPRMKRSIIENVDKSSDSLLNFKYDAEEIFDDFGDLTGGAGEDMENFAEKTGKSADKTAEHLKRIKDAMKGFTDFAKDIRDTRPVVAGALEDIGKEFDNFSKLVGRKKKQDLDKLVAGFEQLTKQVQDKFSTAISEARRQLDDAKREFDGFRDNIAGSIKGILNFGKAAESENFLTGLQKQAEQATGFSDRVRQLIEMGLSKSAIQQVLAAGYESGTQIADEIISGGQTVVDQINQMVDSVEQVAEAVGYFGAEKFFGAGVDSAQALVDGLMQQLASREAEIEAWARRIAEMIRSAQAGQVSTGTGAGKGKGTGTPATKVKYTPPKNIKITTPTAPVFTYGSGSVRPTPTPTFTNTFGGTRITTPFGLSTGGIVTRPSLAMIAEGGEPEAVIPLSKLGNMGGNNYNITVNAGIGTSGADVGRQIVEAIRKYERSSGQVFSKVN